MNSTAMLSQGAAFDQHSLDSLRLEVKRNSAEGMRAAGRQLEGLFVQMMLKSMRDASFKGGLLSSSQSDMFTSMYDQQIAQNIADTGKMGFADQVVAQMEGAPVAHASPSSVPVPLSLNPTWSDHAAAARQIMPAVVNTTRDTPVSEGGSFISRLLRPAIAAAQGSGIPHQLIIAQAALESDWGNREILTASGQPSHNLFGIKATPGWRGKTTEITTTEYKNGVAYRTKDHFKVYSSYAEALSDYTALLAHNPRYHQVVTSSTPETAAKALQSAGYATDPAYAKKLISIIQQVKGRVNQAVHAYASDFSSLF